MKSSRFNRRDFLKAGAVGITMAACNEVFAEVLKPLPTNNSPRLLMPLNHDWHFSEKFAPAAVEPKFNDRSFQTVNLPHSNKRLPLNGFDEQDYCFVSIYRKNFKLPKGVEGKRIFIDFGGVMTAAKVYLNGQSIGENRGGYNDFSFELTKNINWTGENVLAVEVDSTERKDIPPFGDLIDYLTFGGIYREVQLRVVHQTFIENVFAKPLNVLQENRSVNVKTFLRGDQKNLTLTAELFDGENRIASRSQNVSSNAAEVNLNNLGSIELWDTDKPKLYKVRVTLFEGGKTLDHYDTRIGFREAQFTPNGFFLNGKHLKLRGLNRHQTFPFVGGAMPARVQKRDAWILRKELKCNIVRTSHYMQSTHFLDACDEYGLLVFEEIPGWQHIGDKAWQDLAVRDVESMIRRDWNHPSIILWGVRINESPDNHDFYARTNAAARVLDDSRPTGGVRNNYDSERLEDVFTMNDFGFPLKEPNHPLYLNTEFNGHMFPTKRFDNVARHREHTHRHARVHDQIASDKSYAGGLGWCAFDYHTHDFFGSGDRICYHGVSDIFRLPKPAAAFYKSQCAPEEEIVLEPAFDWAGGDEDERFTTALVCSNCEKLKFYVNDKFIKEAEPDRNTYPHLKYAPFAVKLGAFGELRIEGFIGGKKVIERKMSGKGVDQKFEVKADDNELIADGIDMTRVVLKVSDEFGNLRPLSQAAITLSIENGEIIGDNPFPLFGAGAIWIRTTRTPGIIKLTAKHPRLGAKLIQIKANRA